MRYPISPVVLAMLAGSCISNAAAKPLEPFRGVLELSSLDGTDGFVLNGIDVEDRSGISVSSAGDINDDGIDDLMIGAYDADPNGNINAGESYVVFGGVGVGSSGVIELSSLNGTNGFVLNGIDAGDNSGSSVSSAGDVNDDGVDDIIIGALGAGVGNGYWNEGESYVVFGGVGIGSSGVIELSSLSGTNGFVINGIDADDRSGRCVSSAGDVNGDGINDLIIATGYADPNGLNWAGESYVIFGRSSYTDRWIAPSGGAFDDAQNWLSGTVPDSGTPQIKPALGGTITAPAGFLLLDNLILGAVQGQTRFDLQTTSFVGLLGAFIVPGDAALTGSGSFAADTGIANNGLIEMSGMTLQSAGGGIDNSGEISIGFDGAAFVGDVTNIGTADGMGGYTPLGLISIFGGPIVSFGSDVINQSDIVLASDSALVIWGSLVGNGISGPNGAGTAGFVFVEDGVSPGFGPGIAQFDGDLTLGAAGSTLLEIAGTTPGSGHDQIGVTNSLAIDGSASIMLNYGYVPLPGDSFQLLNFGALSGSFSSLTIDPQLLELDVDISNLFIDGTISIPLPFVCIADTNNDGMLDAADFTAWIFAYNANAPECDQNGDGSCTPADFSAWIANFNAGC